MRRALFSLKQLPSSDTPSVDRVYLDRENIARYVISPSSGLWGDDTDESSVFVLFILVRLPPFHDHTPGTRDNKEQVLASMAHSVDVLR